MGFGRTIPWSKFSAHTRTRAESGEADAQFATESQEHMVESEQVSYTARSELHS